MSPPLPHLAWRSCAKSRHRQRVLLMLSSVGEGYLSQLAALLELSPRVVRWSLHGREPYYAVDLSLIQLGLASVRESHRGRVYEITPLGRRKARSIVAARNRRRHDVHTLPPT